MRAESEVAPVTEGAKEVVRLELAREKKIAERFIRASAWWLTHYRGPVRARGFGERLYMSDYGWAVEFGLQFILGCKGNRAM